MKTLSDEALNIAICEWRGWQYHKGKVPKWLAPDGNSLECLSSLPNHITGIEALGHMHEAEKGLDTLPLTQGWNVYLDLLRETEDSCRGICATARHRGIALLRTVKSELFS